jgi:hypothetical protein
MESSVQNKFTLIHNKAIDKPVEYVIVNTSDRSDDWGDMYFNEPTGWWTELALATRFTEEQRIKFSLPSNGMWVNMTEMIHSMEMSKANHPTTGFRQPRLTIVDESE